ncbi:EpsG family protein, partial [Acinetobacter baumannii]
IVLKVFKNSTINYKAIFIFIFLVFSFNYRDLMDINRNIFSYSIFFYYYFLIDKKNIFKLALFSLVAVLVHSSALILLILYLLSNIKLSKFVNMFLLLFSLFLGYFLPDIINKATFFIEFIPIYGEKISYYLYGDAFGVQDFTFGTALKKFLNCFIIFIVSGYIINSIDKNRGDSRQLQFVLFIGFFALIFFNFVTFFERINLAYNFIFLSVFLYGIRSWYAALIAFLIFFRSACMYLLVYFPIFFGDYSSVMVNNTYKNQLMLKPFYYPTLLLLDIHNNGYSDDFISKNSIWKELE